MFIRNEEKKDLLIAKPRSSKQAAFVCYFHKCRDNSAITTVHIDARSDLINEHLRLRSSAIMPKYARNKYTPPTNIPQNRKFHEMIT